MINKKHQPPSLVKKFIRSCGDGLLDDVIKILVENEDFDVHVKLDSGFKDACVFGRDEIINYFLYHTDDFQTEYVQNLFAHKKISTVKQQIFFEKEKPIIKLCIERDDFEKLRGIINNARKGTSREHREII